MSDCSEILKQGIFNSTQYYSEATYRKMVDTFLYKTEFRTHDEAQDAGFSLGFPVYDVPIKVGGTFSDKQRETWKAEHAEVGKLAEDFHSARAAALKTVDKNIVDAWLQCQEIQGKIKANESGLRAGVRPLGTKYVYFWVQFRPPINNAKAIIKIFQATGVKDTGIIKKGDMISVALEGLGAAYEVTDKQNVSFTVQTEGVGSISVDFKPAEYDKLVEEQAQESKFAVAGFIIGEVRTFAFGGSTTDKPTKELRAKGWLECAGQTLNVLEYPELHSVIGNTWGTPAPGVAFSVPDLRGMFLRGWSHGSGRDPDAPARTLTAPGSNGGDAVGSYQADALSLHKHLDSGHQHGIRGTSYQNGAQGLYDQSRNAGFDVGACGLGQANLGGPVALDGTSPVTTSTETRPENVYVSYCIYVGRPVLDNTP